MRERIYVPPIYLKEDEPVVFLAGPIQGASDWHIKAMEIFKELSPELNIASPKRPDFTKEFDPSYEEEGNKFIGKSNVTYDQQVNWETDHLNKAANNGVVMFWLDKEEYHICDRAYAQTTRFELAEWKVKHEYEGTKLAVGIHPEFPGRRYIKMRLTDDCPNIPVVNSLRQTCEEVIKLLNKD